MPPSTDADRAAGAGSTGERRVDLADTTVAYDVRHSGRATKPRIDVGLGGVTVVLPADAAVDARTVLERNATWVVETDREYADARAALPERRFEAGAEFPVFGVPHEVVIERRSASRVVDGRLRLAAHHVEATSVRRALETLYRRTAREQFEALAPAYADAMGVEYESIHVRNQRTKWGSCSTSGTISLNWRLAMAPRPVLEYVVVHEVAHLREPNHSEDFWALVAAHDPEWETHAAWLADHGAELWFSEDDLR